MIKINEANNRVPFVIPRETDSNEVICDEKLSLSRSIEVAMEANKRELIPFRAKFNFSPCGCLLRSRERKFQGSRQTELVTMSFFVEIVTEDSFYENLTLGLVKILENTPCVKNIQIDRRAGCDRNASATWEQRHCCALPDDLRNFYASIDGFLLTWSLEISGEEFSLGRLEVGCLAELKRFLGTKEQQAEAEARLQENPDLPSLSPRCKLFEIGQCGSSKVYLAYVNPDVDPGIWLHREESAEWYYLADSFTRYFRMLLVHLGLPLWQYCSLGLPIPSWVEQVYLLVGPHLLPTTEKPSESVSTTIWNDGPPNTIDSAIFRSKENKPRNTRKK